MTSRESAPPTDPPSIIPDDKDWTWVLTEPCPDCGFDGAHFDAARTAEVTRALGLLWSRLVGAGEDVAVRPDPSVWSTLEYGCHVRDVFELFATRLARMLAEDDPLFDNWDQDATAVAQRYDLQDPATVSADLLRAGEACAAAFGSVEGAAWRRPGRRSDGARFTVESFARYFLHDPVHHLHDVGVAFEV